MVFGKTNFDDFDGLYLIDMYYYFVWVRSSRYHGQTPLTYSYDKRLSTGSIVIVEMQKELVVGVISGSTTKPKFKTKPIVEVFDLPRVPDYLLKVAAWLQAYYPAPLGIIAQQLIPAGLTLKNSSGEAEPIKIGKSNLSKLPKLTKDQVAAVEQISEPNTYVLHGATGSGKTRIYMELAAKALAANKSAIILTPEISLITQLAGNFSQSFGERVVVYHSHQTPLERRKAWLKVLTAKVPVIVIGPRSALFSPVERLGLIVIDESHESAYKQEQAPQYQTGRVASYLAGITRSELVLGSATPSVSDYYLAEQKKKPIITISNLAQDSIHPDSKITFVDRKDHSLFSRSQFLSQPLIEALQAALNRKEQSLLYLNRRGTARLVMCSNCGWQAACPHCDIPLTYHGDHHEMRCHSCNYRSKAPSSCPNCQHPDVTYKTAGTKAIAADVQKLFPQARVSRFDTDNLKAERFEQNYQAIHEGDVDILVGTQLLAKGIDLPKLSTLGILLADTSLYMPDYTSQERTFQLISQVLGRIGRGHVAGHAFIQTYHPDHPVLKAAVNSDYRTFYKAELAERKQYLFPPFCYLLKLTARRSSVNAAMKAAENLKSQIEGSYKVRVEGPAPSFYERLQGKYQWQLIVKALDRQELVKIISALPSGWSYDIDPLDLL